MKKNNKKVIIPLIVVILAAMIALVAKGLTRGFDAKEYVAAILEQTYYGNVEKAAEIMDDVTEEELYQQYEAGVTSFVKNNVISGIIVDEQTELKFVELGKEIFKAMKFEVIAKEDVSNQESYVTVSYQPSDIFLKYIEYVQDENKNISEKVENGEYKGTVEEINEQLQKEFVRAAYVLLEKAYADMEYGEAEEMQFVITRNQEDLYELSEETLHDFMIKIMKLDQIQD